MAEQNKWDSSQRKEQQNKWVRLVMRMMRSHQSEEEEEGDGMMVHKLKHFKFKRLSVFPC